MNPPSSAFVIIITQASYQRGGKYLQGPRTPEKVKRHGYGFTADPSEAWPFSTEAAAKAKARIVDRHMGWGDGVLAAQPLIDPSEPAPLH